MGRVCKARVATCRDSLFLGPWGASDVVSGILTDPKTRTEQKGVFIFQVIVTV